MALYLFARSFVVMCVIHSALKVPLLIGLLFSNFCVLLLRSNVATIDGTFSLLHLSPLGPLKSCNLWRQSSSLGQTIKFIVVILPPSLCFLKYLYRLEV